MGYEARPEQAGSLDPVRRTEQREVADVNISPNRIRPATPAISRLIPPSGREWARAPHRAVVLEDGPTSPLRRVLAEYPEDRASRTIITEELVQYAAEYRGRFLAVEWLGPCGWMRFLWIRM